MSAAVVSAELDHAAYHALWVGVLNLPPVIRLVLVVEVSDSGDVRRVAVNSGPMRCRLLGSDVPRT